MPKDGLWIENDEGWGWIVGPEFGCVHFQVSPGVEDNSGKEEQA
jgi:hypothetical protein